MTAIGMFHYRKDPKKVRRAYSYASVAKMEGIDFFYFSSKRVDFETNIIKGLVYEDGKWVEQEFPFPDVIINPVGPLSKNKKQTEIYLKLKKMIPVTSFPVGTKLTVYNKIKKGKQFTDHLIPYRKIKKPVNVLTFLNKHDRIIIKPISGHHGNKVVYIEKMKNKFKVVENDATRNLERIELHDYIGDLLKEQKMLIQKYIECRRKTGEPYDIRLHIQKDDEGKWRNTIVYPKIGLRDKITSNLGQGGQMTSINQFLYKEFGHNYFNIKLYLEVFAIQFAEYFDTLYDHSYDELGIDVGIDSKQNVWIYEVNWRPGHLYLEEKAAKLAIMYANYLAEKENKKREENHETNQTDGNLPTI